LIKISIYLVLISLNLSAHQLKENYLTIHYNESQKSFYIDLKIETRLLETHMNFDDNHNEIISYKELYAHQLDLLTYINKYVKFSYKHKPLSLLDANITFYRNQDQTYMQIQDTFKPISLDKLTLSYTLFFNYEKDHKLLIHLDDLRGDYTLKNNHHSYTFSSYRMGQLQRLGIYIKNGFHHILDGIDHLLFILMLLLSVTATYKNKKLKKESFIFLFKLITLFSIAHSISLFIAAFKLYTPNVVFIESSIALSIFIVALFNVMHKYRHTNYLIVFLFGLLHGFGFANVLTMIDVKDITSFIISLFGFNLGVELGQILVILILLPFLYLLTYFRCADKIIQLISFFSMGIALYWFLQRVGLV